MRSTQQGGLTDMSPDPSFEARAPQPYVGVRRTTTLATFPQVVDSGWPVVFGWLADHDVAWAGAPFIRYRTIDMEGELEIDLAVPVAAGGGGDGEVEADELPGGRYLVVRHVGPYAGLLDANAALRQWAGEHDVEFAMDHKGAREEWVSRVEHYPTNPAEEPDSSKWEVVIAYLTRD